MSVKKKIIIIGAGLTGPLLALYMNRLGYLVDLYERGKDFRKANIYSGRSINLALSERGIFSLKEVGLYEEISKNLIPMQGRMIHDKRGKESFQKYGQYDNECIYSVSRSYLNELLIDKAEECKNVKLFFNKKCTAYDSEKNQLIFNHDEVVNVRDPILGADGYNSIIRESITDTMEINCRKKQLEYGYKEICLPKYQSRFQLNHNALHIWPRKSFMLIALPNTDKTFTCTLFYPLKGRSSFESLKTKKEIENFFIENFRDVYKLIPNLFEQFTSNPIGRLGSIYLDKWVLKDKVCLLGDAAHAVVPFFGQGMNASFQDCSNLFKILGKESTISSAFKKYNDTSVENGHSIADMALENFIEMRSDVIDEQYLLKKKISFILEKKYPLQFIPRYSMVSFHRIPYNEVAERAIIQEQILNTLCLDNLHNFDFDLELADKLISSKLNLISLDSLSRA